MPLGSAQLSPSRKFLILTALIIAGEVIFLLPFVFARIFRPTLLDVFELTNFELGSAFSAYGVVAVISYFLGGPIADRFSARRLMSIALVVTAAGGIVYGTIPSISVLVVLYGFWGMTTILLFWAALIRSTRVWGGARNQGKAYGLLDGGRGLVAALLASFSVFLFSTMLPEDVYTASMQEKRLALQKVIWLFTGITILAAMLIWLVIPPRKPRPESAGAQSIVRSNLVVALRDPTVWLQAIIVVCAYVGYKATDDFSLFARDAFGYDDVKAARIGTITFWMRPVTALAAGFLADKVRASRVVIMGFAVMAIGALAIGLGLLNPNMGVALVAIIITTSLGIYALRAVYFALVAEAGIPLAITGTSVGIISMVGFLPDVFMGPLMGYLLDRSPGAEGHEHVFLAVAVFAAIGLLASVAFRMVVRRRSNVAS